MNWMNLLFIKYKQFTYSVPFEGILSYDLALNLYSTITKVFHQRRTRSNKIGKKTSGVDSESSTEKSLNSLAYV